MITDKTLDEALVEVMRCKRALEALRKARKRGDIVPAFRVCDNVDCLLVNSPGPHGCYGCGGTELTVVRERNAIHAAALRASMDLTRKLADLRAGR